MQTNVSGLLREFPKAKRAALAGERVTIKTREGNLVLTAENPPSGDLFGLLAGSIKTKGLKAETSGAGVGDWKASL